MKTESHDDVDVVVCALTGQSCSSCCCRHVVKCSKRYLLSACCRSAVLQSRTLWLLSVLMTDAVARTQVCLHSSVLVILNKLWQGYLVT